MEFSTRRQRLFYIFLLDGRYGGEKRMLVHESTSSGSFLLYVSVRYSDTLKTSQVSRDKNSISV